MTVRQNFQTTFCPEHLEVHNKPICMDVAIGMVCTHEPHIVRNFTVIVHNVDFGPKMLD